MFFSLAKLATTRPDRRPLYRRIFTNRRLDRLHRYTVRGIVGFILFSTSFCLVNGVIYYWYPGSTCVRNISIPVISQYNIWIFTHSSSIFIPIHLFSPLFFSNQLQASSNMNIVAKFFSEVGRTYPRLLLFGISAGAGFELFKIYFAPKGISYYKVFKKNNLHRELEKYENDLRETERTLVEYAKSKGIKVNGGVE